MDAAIIQDAERRNLLHDHQINATAVNRHALFPNVLITSLQELEQK
jgi:hypothetical protein